MNEKPISHDQLIEPGVFNPTIADAAVLHRWAVKLQSDFELLHALTKEYKRMAVETGKEIKLIEPKSLADYDRLTKLGERMNGIQSVALKNTEARIVVEKKLTQVRDEAIKRDGDWQTLLNSNAGVESTEALINKLNELKNTTAVLQKEEKVLMDLREKSNSPKIVEQLEEKLKSVREEMARVNSEAVATNKALQATAAPTVQPGSQTQPTEKLELPSKSEDGKRKEIAQTSEAYADLVAQYKAAALEARNLAAAHGVESKAAQDAAKKANALNKELKEVNSLQKPEKVNKNQITFDTAKLGSVIRMRAELALVTDEWSKLSEAERENTERGKALSKQKLDLTNKLKVLEAKTGDNRRNVGNYGAAILKATKGLSGFSLIVSKVASVLGFNTAAWEANLQAIGEVVQSARAIKDIAEAQKVALDASTTATIANEGATKKAGIGQRIYASLVDTTTGKLRLMRVALLGAVTLGVGAAIVGLIAYWDDIADAISGTTEAQRTQLEVSKAAVETYAAEEVALNRLVDTAKDSTLSYQQRKDAVDKLREKYPSYLENLNTENAASKEIADTLNNRLIPALKARAKITAAEDLIVETTKKTVQSQLDAQDAAQGLTTTFGALANTALYDLSLGYLGAQAKLKSFSKESEKAAQTINSLNGIIQENTQIVNNAGDTDYESQLTALAEAREQAQQQLLQENENTVKYFNDRRTLLKAQYDLEARDISKSDAEKTTLHVQYLKDLRELDREQRDFQLNSQKAALDGQLLDIQRQKGLMEKLTQDEIDVRVKALAKQRDIDLNEAGISAGERKRIEAEYLKGVNDLYLQFGEQRRQITERLQNAQIDAITNSYDKQIESEKANLQRVLNEIRGNSEEEIKLKEQLITNSQKLIDDLTLEKDLKAAQTATATRVLLAKQGSQEEYDTKVADLEAQRLLEVAAATRKGEDVAIVNAKFRKQEEDLTRAFNRRMNEERNRDIAEAELLAVHRMGASARKILEAEKKAALARRDYLLSQDGLTNAQRLLIEEQYLTAVADLEAKHRADQVDKVNEVTDEIFGIKQAGVEREKQLNDDKISALDRQIDQQFQLMSRGLDNTYDFQLRKRAEAEAEKAEIEKRAQKQEEARQMAATFFELVKGYVAKGENGLVAAAKAMGETLAIKGFAEIFAGAFATGTENLSGPGTETSDSLLIRASRGESVITAKGTKEAPGLATMWNKKGVRGVMEWTLNKLSIRQALEGLNTPAAKFGKPVGPTIVKASAMGKMDLPATVQLPNVIVPQTPPPPSNEKLEQLLSAQVERLESLEKAIVNRPVSGLTTNAVGELVQIVYKDGVTTETTFKKNLINRNRRRN